MRREPKDVTITKDSDFKKVNDLIVKKGYRICGITLSNVGEDIEHFVLTLR
jgi:hypothetical protein